MACYTARYYSLLKNLQLPRIKTQLAPHRSLFYWVTIIFNKVDPVRIKEVGPDRACAEWILRNGGTVKWKGDKDYLADYNALPSEGFPVKYIQAIDATNSSISHHGFPHFKGCKHIQELKLVHCVYVENEAVPLISLLRDTLIDLEIKNCGNITDESLYTLKDLTNLKALKLANLQHVKNKSDVLEKLTKALPNCKIDYN